MPVGVSGSLLRKPTSLPATVRALGRLRSELRQPGSILQLHRPYRHFLFNSHHGSRVQIIHLDLDAWPGPAGWHRLNWIYREFDRDLDRFDRVFVANEAGAQRLRREHPEVAERIEFLSGWYDPSVFHPASDGTRSESRSALARQFDLPGDAATAQWVLFAGRLDPVKDPELAVDAFARLAGSVDNVRLIVCGDGEALPAMTARAEQSRIMEHIHFIGEQPRSVLADLMAASDVLLVSSIAEGGGPRVVLEALGSGLPVVSTIAGEVRRSVKSGVNGWLAEERTPEALARGLLWALDQQREQVSAAAVAAAAPFVSWVVLQQLYEAYRELAADAGP